MINISLGKTAPKSQGTLYTLVSSFSSPASGSIHNTNFSSPSSDSMHNFTCQWFDTPHKLISVHLPVVRYTTQTDFSSPVTCATHKNVHLSFQFTCQLCYKPIKGKQYFVFHLRAVHGIGEPVRCKHCGKADFKAPATFNLHVRKCAQSSADTN